MAPRALRKLQKEQEIQRQLAAAKAAQEAGLEDSDEEEKEIQTTPQPRNAFDMLNAAEQDEESDHSEPSESDQRPEPAQVQSHPQPSKSKKKKKKQKKKSKTNTAPDTPADASEDEIDRALKELAIKDNQTRQEEGTTTSSWEATATELLAPDQKFLNPVNEMRSLFGNIALENQDDTGPAQPQRRREINLQGGVDLATALSGSHCIGSRGKELGSLATRRNCFVQGRPSWPLATSGGLSMENVASEGFAKQYNIMHNSTYQGVQHQFRQAVETMQPEPIIGLLTANPYHVASLLQVSEIAKHQGDHSLSGDLLERALFTIGRSVHSSFPAAMKSGNARLDFNRPANRELYLAIWRHIRNLEQRGTWRTAFEWSKILLQFDTLSDPYGVTMMIDQFALRGRQHEQLLELASDDAYGNTWRHLPNIQVSLALAYLRSQKPKDARRQLAVAMHQYPYLLSALASALEISPIPKSLWGKIPSTDAEKLYSELYVTRAKDLWNAPETTSLIGEVAETLEYYTDAIASAPPAPKLEISLEEARHIMLLEIPNLIALLPRQFRGMQTSASDVLPPPTSISDFTARAPTDATGSGSNGLQAIFSAAGNAAGSPFQGVNGMLQQILNWFHAPAGPTNTDTSNTGESRGQAAFRALREELVAASPGREVTDEMVEAYIHDQLVGDEHEPVTAAGLGMAGGWDYYAEMADARSDEDEDSMPDLESITDRTPTEQSLQTPTNPHAATVEEAASDNEDASAGAAPAGRFVLRSVDSDDEDDAAPFQQPQPQEQYPAVPSVQPASVAPSLATPVPPSATQGSPNNPDPDNSILNSNDVQRIQRYLLTTGLTALQANPSTLPHYMERLQVLRKQQQDWIINMISQRGSDTQELVDRLRRAVQ